MQQPNSQNKNDGDADTVTIYMCLGYALGKDDKNNPIIAEILKERLDYLKNLFLLNDWSSDSANQPLVLLCGRGKIDIEAKHMAEYLKESCKHSLDGLSQNTNENSK